MVRTCVLAAVVAISGCATFQKEASWRERVSRHVYRQPLEVVWPQVRSLVAEEGYSFKEQAGQFILVTDWREEAQSSKARITWTRVLAQGVRVDDSRCLVRFVLHTTVTSTLGLDREQRALEANFGREYGRHQQMNDQVSSGAYLHTAQEIPVQASELFQKRTGTASAARHTEMEWQLIARVDPTVTDRIARETEHPSP